MLPLQNMDHDDDGHQSDPGDLQDVPHLQEKRHLFTMGLIITAPLNGTMQT